MTDPDCHYGDHLWMGTGACVRCGVQLRCGCGAFVREDDLDRHIRESCRLAAEIRWEEREAIERTFAP